MLTLCSYNLFLHPLSSYPGPFLWRALRLPYVIRALQSHLAYDMLELHKRYRPIGGTYDHEMPRWKTYYKVQPNQKGMIFTTPPAEYSQMRRALSYGFSERGIRDMESRMIGTLDKFLGRLIEFCNDRDGVLPDRPAQGSSKLGSAVINIAKWCNFMTFDLIGELTFGESYECLKTGIYHPWVKPVVELTRYSGIFSNLGFYPKFQGALLKVFGSLTCRRMDFHQKHTRAALERRAVKVDRMDLLSESIKQTQASEDPGAWDKLVMNSSALVIAGSETTATTLTAAIYLLLSNPEAYREVVAEIRSAFTSEDDITMAGVNKLDYMLVCLNETMRMLPAVPVGIPRMVPKGGRVLNDRYVTAGTIVTIWHWALYHNENFFRAPFEFHPERFLGTEKFASDARHLLQPFHVGRRACIGRSLAYVEMRLTLARLLFRLDVELTDQSLKWAEQLRPYNLWFKASLYVRIKVRRRDGDDAGAYDLQC
ncbi:cytochrome P450 ClCP1 [Bimuria novae-zelandiae CBS 107.79]|uniref:Cytochrome P450 ClCP1 n=1 Tax=Bimuria novae-zelandiae CBS 107.79 TaxID=1447943 RepID=A0A6A5UYN4_9PLEO|nr:cytochrome P450 ClCP1 [Bimuria novae-zelandiae CBS 107.79]